MILDVGSQEGLTWAVSADVFIPDRKGGSCSQEQKHLAGMIAMFTHPWPSFEKTDFPAGQTGVMDEFITQGAPLPATLQEGVVTIQTEPAHPAVFRLNPQ